LGAMATQMPLSSGPNEVFTNPPLPKSASRVPACANRVMTMNWERAKRSKKGFITGVFNIMPK